MSDTPRHDDPEGRPYRDPTAPGDESFSTSGSSFGQSGEADQAGDAGATEHTEQLPTSGDTQQVPAASGPDAPPSNPYGQSYPPPPPPPGYGSAPGAEPGYGSAPGAQPGYGTPPSTPGYGAASPQPGYGSAPYGSAPGYGNAPYGSAPGYGTPAQGSPAAMSGSTIALLVVSGLLTIGACGTGIPALVFAILAATKKDEPAEAAKWTRWGWIALGITVVVVVIAIVGFVALAVSTGTSSGY